MGEPFLAEIKICAFGFAPKGWALCNGALMAINQNQALFSILGTVYGGNGSITFGLPDLRGRTPVHPGLGYNQGQAAGLEAVTLLPTQMPTHSHIVNAVSATGSSNNPSNNALAASPGTVYRAFTNVVEMAAENISTSGGSQPHSNLQPYLALNMCIALQGIFPSRN